MQIRVHAGRRFVGNLDRIFQNALRYDVAVDSCRRLSAHEDTEVLVASNTVLFKFVLQRHQPSSHQVDVLQRKSKSLISCNFLFQRLYKRFSKCDYASETVIRKVFSRDSTCFLVYLSIVLRSLSYFCRNNVCAGAFFIAFIFMRFQVSRKKPECRSS